MRLLIDSLFLNSPGGIQLKNELTRSIIECAPRDCKVVLLEKEDIAKKSFHDDNNIITCKIPFGGWFGRLRWFARLLPDIAQNYKIDVIYSLSGILSANICKSFGTVASVNNMVPFSPEILRLYPILSNERLKYELLRRIYVHSLRMADAIVLHSQNALDMITRYTGNINSKTFPVLTGVPRDIIIKGVNLSPHPCGGVPYLLYFSAIYPYKNHLKLIEAYGRALLSETSLPDLLMIGLPQHKKQVNEILNTILRLGLEKKVKYIGEIKRDSIPAWLYHAEINLFPSICETNSVIIAEILGVGGVLACSNIMPMTEVVKDAAELFDPYSVDSIAAAIVSLFRNAERRKTLRRLALKRSTEFSWNECGDAIWSAAKLAKTALDKRKEKNGVCK